MDTEANHTDLPDAVSPTAAEAPTKIRGFWALIATQFQGACSDNILRNLLLSIIVGMGLAKNERETFVSVVTIIFSVPFLLLSMPGGWLADRYSKRQITIWTKLMEVGSVVIATIGLATHSLPIALSALTLVAAQAALFGPSKYGLLPELLPAKRLSWGNGVIELGTFLAIIIGTVAGATMAEKFHGREVNRIVVQAEHIEIRLRLAAILHELLGSDPAGQGVQAAAKFLPIASVTCPFKHMDSGRALRLVIANDRVSNDRSRQLILRAIARARHWYQRIVNGEATCLNDIIRRDGIDASHAKKIFPLAFLSPSCTQSILHFNTDFTLKALLANIAMEWSRQSIPLPLHSLE